MLRPATGSAATRMNRTFAGLSVLLLLPALLLASGERWVYRWMGPGIQDGTANDVVCDGSANVYAAGWFRDSLTGRQHWAVLGLSSTGHLRWTYAYDDSGSSFDQACAIALGTDGNLYTGGTTWTDSTYQDFTIISLTTDGQERWVRRPRDLEDGSATSIACDSSGRIYVAGHMQSLFTVVCLDTAGATRWVYNHQDTTGPSDLARSVTVGTDGNIYAAGNTAGDNIFSDFAVISLDSTGHERWVYEYDGPGAWSDYAYAVAWGDDGNVHAAGLSWESDFTNDDFTVISLTPEGGERWVYRYVGDWFDVAYDVTYGADGNVYACGTSTEQAWYQFTVTSLTKDGVERWSRRYGTGENDKAYSLAMGADRHIYAAGVTAVPVAEFATFCLDTAGSRVWMCTTGFYVHGAAAQGMACGTDGNVYVAGASGDDRVTRRLFTVASFAPVPGVCEPGSLPFEGHTGIPGFAFGRIPARLLGKHAYPVRMTIHDCRGALVAEEVVTASDMWPATAVRVAGRLAGGVYLLQVRTRAGETGSAKVLRLR